MNRLLVVSCGGTISSTTAGAAAAVPRLTAHDLVAGAGSGGPDGAVVETVVHSTVASSAMGLDDVVALARTIGAWVDTIGDDALGVVVTHGTDTLEEVAFGVDLLWGRDVPVVFTGAMRHAGLPSPDGPANLQAALATATHPDARGAGVLVVLDDRVHLASTVRKTHTTDVSTFRSATVGPVGYVVEGRARIVLHRAHRPPPLPMPAGPLNPASLNPAPVALLTSSLGEDDRLLRGVLDAGHRGLVIEALGGGHLPPGVAASPALAELVEQMTVVLASRTGAGETLRGTYGFPGSEVDLLGRGLLGAGALTGPQARVLLSLALAAGLDRAGIEAAFAAHG